MGTVRRSRHRTRVLPSGRPPEESVTLVQDDPTWALEYEHFKTLCRERRPTDLANDIWLNRALREARRRDGGHGARVMKPVIGFAGMTHLGLVSASAAAGKGFRTVGFDPDRVADRPPGTTATCRSSSPVCRS